MERGLRHQSTGMKHPVVLFITLLGTSALAQTPPGEPEVRRAIPVTPTPLSDYDNPPWVQRVLPAQPVSTPMPEATPIPVATPIPMSPPLTEPFRPPPRPAVPEAPAIAPAAPAEPSVPVTDEDGTIRIAPVSPEETAKRTLALANSLYSRKMYDLAVPEYEMYLISGVKDSRDAALFRLAECHRMLDNLPAARAGYEKLVMEYQIGEFAGAGAYRLGEMLFAQRLYDAAHLQFETAAREAKDPEVRLTARYFSARSLDYLKRDPEAITAYRAVVDTEGKNPYREHARMALAALELRAGRKPAAQAAYEEIASSKSTLATEAAVKAAALAAEFGQREKALKLFDQAVADSRSTEWKPVALIGALRLRYQGGDYKGVVEMGPSTIDALTDDSKPEALQLLAASYRQTGNNLEARRTYDRLIKEFPDAAPAGDARLQRLVSLYSLNDKSLIAEVDAFLAGETNPRARTQASLLKAEALYKEGNFPAAGEIYQSLVNAELDPALHADTLYKLGWCLAASDNPQAAVGIYSEFLEKYPAHAMAASALARRALAHQQGKAFEAAMTDFNRVIEKYPGSAEHELALQQKALIHGQKQEYDAMAKDFGELLEKFPKTAAAAQANFWLGWAAFEQKDYKTAIERLAAARKLDAAQYNERASLRIILAYYYLEDRANVLREAADYQGGNLPAEISLWLAAKEFDDGNFAKAESLLAPLMANPAAIPPDALIQLAEARLRTGKIQEASAPVDKYLETARDPASRARGILASARIAAAQKNSAEATRLVEEALLLQPEGPLNAQARMLSGDLLLARSDYDGAARAFMTVSVLTDDPAITPLALQKAADAYRRANNTFEADRALAELRERYPDFQKSDPKKKDRT